MYLLQYIERMGTGTVDMIRRCAETGLPEPEFEVGAGFLIRIWRSGNRETTQDHRDTTQEATRNHQKTTRKPPERKGDRQNLANRILTFLREHPSASRRDIVGALEGTTEGSVRYQLEKLKELGKLRRVGPDRGGTGRLSTIPKRTPGRSPMTLRGTVGTQGRISQKTARTPAENLQNPTRKPPETKANRQNLHPFSAVSWLSFARIRTRAAAKSPPPSAPRDPSSGTGWTSCARPGRSSGSVLTRAATGRCWVNPLSSPALPPNATPGAPDDRSRRTLDPYPSPRHQALPLFPDRRDSSGVPWATLR